MDPKGLFEKFILPYAPSDFLGCFRLEKPIAVRAVDDMSWQWHIPITVGSTVVAWMDVSPDGRLLRYSFRVQNATDLSALTEEITQMTREKIQTLLSNADGTLPCLRCDPVLVSLSGGSRLAWKADIVTKDGIQTWLASPDAVWPYSPSADDVEA